jgi:hypothetical protein
MMDAKVCLLKSTRQKMHVLFISVDCFNNERGPSTFFIIFLLSTLHQKAFLTKDQYYLHLVL